MIELNTAMSTVVGAAIALGGVWLTNRETNRRFALQLDREERREKRDFIRQRGEELYDAADQWAGMIWARHMFWLRVAYGKLTVEQAEQLEREQVEKLAPGKYQKLTMLVDIYFHNLTDAHKNMVACRDDLNKSQWKILNIANSKASDLPRHAKEHDALMEKFEEARVAFLTLLTGAIRDA